MSLKANLHTQTLDTVRHALSRVSIEQQTRIVDKLALDLRAMAAGLTSATDPVEALFSTRKQIDELRTGLARDFEAIRKNKVDAAADVMKRVFMTRSRIEEEIFLCRQTMRALTENTRAIELRQRGGLTEAEIARIAPDPEPGMEYFAAEAKLQALTDELDAIGKFFTNYDLSLLIGTRLEQYAPKIAA
ncbi:hypothetical protein F6R98_19985 [Candidatus Methylospira mobilis]|uniref:Uncharacterized protein n=1 Tax=Candidatus Methylospira mobilis TaxID=1808979 RepID=A0A5Q0BR03_9GAMM|nr:hypothetical protein [Candidatus Methylospira mobilis]QFY44624.1 hypothetical protein F6R98_19985 [Candidatus Methylospira mobilis]